MLISHYYRELGFQISVLPFYWVRAGVVDRSKPVVYVESVGDLLHDVTYELNTIVTNYPTWQEYLVNQKFGASLGYGLD